jgi:cellulose synthase/poly-beta-1,6-N-acetylglucosamine synthase-like glycosyltransferase
VSAVLTAIAWLLALATALPLAVLIMELVAGLLPSRCREVPPRSGSVAVLIPAHDEAGGIGATLSALQEVTPPDTRILVVADNCTDDTAGIAREAGVEVVERRDPARRGKGYALAFGRDQLAAETTPPEVVIVLDADCRLSSGSLAALCREALIRGTPVQSVNLIEPDLAAPPMVQISSFAMVVKNLFRSRGMQRMGGAALLTGTGMAFPWPLFAQAELATGSIVEDLSLGVEMTRAGHAPYLVEDAHVRSAPAAIGDALQQRRRWEHGFLDTLRQQALPVLWGGMQRRARREILLGLHLLVPPLALLLAISAVAAAVLFGLAVLGAGSAPVITLSTLLGVVLALVGAAWYFGGRTFLTAGALVRAPLYILWKLPIYAGFLRKPQASWTRTPRQP